MNTVKTNINKTDINETYNHTIPTYQEEVYREVGKVGREDKCIKILAELDNIKGLGLIERKKIRIGKM